MEELPGIIKCYRAHILRLRRAPKVEHFSVCPMTNGTTGVIKLFALEGVG
jgi:hypothetical protein